MSAQRFKVDTSKCNKCRLCEEYLPGFIDKYKGNGLIAGKWLADGSIRMRILNAAINCPQNCIDIPWCDDD